MIFSASRLPRRTVQIHLIVRGRFGGNKGRFPAGKRWRSDSSGKSTKTTTDAPIQQPKQQPLPTAAAAAATPAMVRSGSFAIGALAGTCGSLAGMGGGFVMVPLLTSGTLGLRLTQHQAHATSLFAVATTGLAGAVSYSGSVDTEAAAVIALFGMVTATFGANLSAKLSQKALKRALGVFMLLVAPTIPSKDYLLGLASSARSKTQEPSAKTSGDGNDTSNNNNNNNDKNGFVFAKRHIIASGIGCCSGFLAGMFGVGGGAIVVPALSLLMDMNHYQALGTSLCAMVPTAIVGTATHMSKGTVAMRVAPALALGAFAGGLVGGNLGLSIPEQELKYGFSGTMVVLGLRTLLKS